MTALPSIYRIELPANPSTPATLFLAFGAKAPTDTTTLVISAALLMGALGRTIVGTPTVTCTPLTIANITQNQSVTSFQVSGGADGSAYGITWVATLDDGSTITRTIWLPVASGSWNWAGLTVVAKGDQGVPGTIGPAGGVLPLAPLTLATPGGYGTNGGGATSTSALIANIGTGSDRRLSTFENSATENCGVPGGSARPTTGIFSCIENANLAIANGAFVGTPTVDPALIIQAAVNWCSAENNSASTSLVTQVQFLWDQGGYFPNFSQVVIPDAGKVYCSGMAGVPMPWFESPLDTKVSLGPYGIADGLFINQTQDTATIRCKDVTLADFGLCKPVTYATNYYSGLFTTAFKDNISNSAGNWTNLTPLFTWLTSSNATALAAMVAGGTTLYFDTLPVGYTLAALQALLTTQPAGHSVQGYNLQFLGLGCPCTSITASTLSGYSGYQAVFGNPVYSDPQYTGYPLQATIPAPKAAQLDTPAYPALLGFPATPELIAEPAIPSPSIIFYTGPTYQVYNGTQISGPYYARGHALNLVVDNLTLKNLQTFGFSQGQAFGNLQSRNYLNLYAQTFCNDLRQTTGGERIQGGYGTTVSPRYSTGDQPLEPQTAVKFYANGNLKPWSNADVQWDIYDPVIFCPNAACVALANEIPDSKQSFRLTAAANVTVGTSTCTFAAGSFTGILPPTGTGSMPAAAVLGYNFVQAGYNGDQTSLEYVGNVASLIPGSFVVGYTDSGGSVGANGTSGTVNGVGPFSLTFAAPQSAGGQACWYRSPGVPPQVTFSVGIPVGGLSSYNHTRVYGGYLRSGAPNCVVHNANKDNQLLSCLDMFGTIIDGWYQTGNGAVGITVEGSNFGGASLGLYGVKVYNSGIGAVSTSGNVVRLVIDADCYFGQPQNGRVAGYSYTSVPNGYITGANNGRVAGTWEASRANAALQIGDINSSLNISVPSANNSNSLIVDKPTLNYCYDGQYALLIANSANVDVSAVFNQATLLGHGSAGAVQLLGNVGTGVDAARAPQNVRLNSINAANMDGPMLNLVGTGSTYVTGADLVPGASGLPTLNPSPGLITTPTYDRGSISTGTHTVPAFTGILQPTFLTQGATVATATLNLPTGAFSGQLIPVSTNSQITSLTVPNSTWPAGTTLSAGNGIMFCWDAISALWKAVSYV